MYVNAPIDINPTSLQQWNVSVQRQFGDWMLSTTYLGNHSTNLWRATELNPAITGATTGNINQRRRLILQNPVEGPSYGTIGHVDDTGRGNYHGLLLSAQRRLKNNLSVLTNYSLSKCMADPGDHRDYRADHCRSQQSGCSTTGPCSSDRRHVFNVSGVYNVGQVGSGVAGAILSDWQFAPLVRWQSGNRSSITTGVDNALTGMGGQRGVQVLDDPYGDGTPDFYLNRAAFTSPAAGTYSPLIPFSVVNPSRLQNDLAITRTFKIGPAQKPASSAGRSSTSSTT